MKTLLRRIVTSADPTEQRKPDTLYLTPEENIRLSTGDVSHFIEAFIIRQRCIPNLLLNDDYHYSFSLYYFYCVCGGKKRVATAKPEHLYKIKQEIASIVQVLSDNYSDLNTLNLQNISQKYSNDGYFASLDELLEDMQEVSREEVGCILKHDYIERLIRKHLDEHYQFLSKLSTQEKRLAPIRELLLPLNLELRLINELKIYTIGDLLDSFHFGAFSQTSNIRITDKKVVSNFQKYELKIHKELFGLNLRSQLNVSAGQLLMLCNILTIIKAI